MKWIKKMSMFSVTLLLCFSLIFNSKVVVSGALKGIGLCVDIVIPSTFAFMVIANFIPLSGIGKWIVSPFLPLTRLLLHIPDEGACAVIMSFIGGYPAGAKTLATMVEYDILPRSTAAKMFLYTTNVSPSFAIMAVGQIMWGRPTIGIVIYICAMISSIIIGMFVRPKYKTISHDPENILSTGTAFVIAVNNASTAMISICGFIVFFATINELIVILELPLYISVLLGGILEVTGGCKAISQFHSLYGILLTAFFLSFSGISIIFQNISIATSSGIQTQGYIKYRIIHAFLTTTLTYFSFRFIPMPSVVMAMSSPPKIIYSANQMVGAVCLIGMCIMITLSNQKIKKHKKF